MGYLPRDCGKCLRVIENKKGFYCTALKRYIFNVQVTGIHLIEPSEKVAYYDSDAHGGLVINNTERYDSGCDFKPNSDYNIGDYYEPPDSMR